MRQHNVYAITDKLHHSELTKANGSFASSYYIKDARGSRGTRFYNCTSKQADQIIKAYKDIGVYLIEGDDTQVVACHAQLRAVPALRRRRELLTTMMAPLTTRSERPSFRADGQALDVSPTRERCASTIS